MKSHDKTVNSEKNAVTTKIQTLIAAREMTIEGNIDIFSNISQSYMFTFR